MRWEFSKDFRLFFDGSTGHWTYVREVFKSLILLNMKKRTRETAKLRFLVFDTKIYYAVSLKVLFLLTLKFFIDMEKL